MIIIPELRICDQNVPKIASSSAKSRLYKLLSGREFNPKDSALTFGTKNVRRFLSMYSNRGR